MTQAKIAHDIRPGSPYDRGSADRYYGGPRSPHYYKSSFAGSTRVSEDQMTKDEIAAYHAGYDQETGRKDWGK